MRTLLPLLFLLAPTSVLADSETPPEGPPWQTGLLEAQAKALRSNTPVFCYFTKTR